MSGAELNNALTMLAKLDESKRRETLLFIASMIEHVKVVEYETADLRRRAALLALGLDPTKDFTR